MHDDDRLLGRVLTRREVLRLLGGTSVVLLTGCWGKNAASTPQAIPTQSGSAAPAGGQLRPAPTSATRSDQPAPPVTVVAPTSAPQATAAALALPSCVVRPEQMEGPYFVDARLERSDIRVDPAGGAVIAGAPLRLTFRVSQVGAASCTALPGAMVDVWHCDAAGVYSGVRDRNFDTSEALFLRGAQRTGEQGVAEFLTIYPGWYPGRAVHIHFKIRTDPDATAGYAFTSQFYFDDALTDRVHMQPPYTSGQNRTRNEQDSLYRNGGDQLLLDVIADGEGYAATFDIGLVLA